MAEQRLTQEQLLTATENDDAAIRLTATGLETIAINADASERLTQLLLLSQGVNANSSARLTQITWLTITARPAEGCAAPWTIPTPAAYPMPSAGGPQYLYFDEILGDWNNFGGQFPDLTPNFGAIQTTHVRRFIIDYGGLDLTQAAILDDHYDSTRGGLSFTLTHPRTAEVITGVRYEEYTRTPHQRLWSQTRSVRLIKYTN